jgi:hypothetical protein
MLLKDVAFETGRSKAHFDFKIQSNHPGVSQHTLVDWNNFIREVCVEHFNNNAIQIGGPGVYFLSCSYHKQSCH